MNETIHCDLLVIGSGPGGYRSALEGAQRGLSTVLVEKEKLGGTCLNWGCIPTKLFLGSSASMAELSNQVRLKTARGDISLDLTALQKRKKNLIQGTQKAMSGDLKKNEISLIQGHARFHDTTTAIVEKDDQKTSVKFSSCIIATGSMPAYPPGLKADGKKFLNSTQLLSRDKPIGHLAVIGAGAIGLELAQFWSRCKTSITLLEALPRVAPGEDPEVSKVFHSIFRRMGWKIHTDTRVVEAAASDSEVHLKLDSGKSVQCDCVLICTGRKPNAEHLHLEAARINTDKKGFIQTDDFLRAAPSIYAVGDVNGKQLLAHAADHQAQYVINHLVESQTNPYDGRYIPSCIYGNTEVIRVGRIPSDKSTHGLERVSRSMLAANPIAQSHGAPLGFIKVFWRKEKISGMTGIGHGVSGLITLAQTIVQEGWNRKRCREAIFAHPTLDESLKEALLAVQEKI